MPAVQEDKYSYRTGAGLWKGEKDRSCTVEMSRQVSLFYRGQSIPRGQELYRGDE